MSDYISRQDAIEALCSIDEYNALSVKTIKELPSVQPEPKTGKWINNIHDIPICDQCGYMTPYDRAIDDYEYGNFCPNCGCSMKEGDTND